MIALGTIPLHAVGNDAVAAAYDLRLSVAMLAGLIAVLVTLAVMRLQSYGYIPAYVAAAALWNTEPEEISRSGATAVLLASGILAGLLFELSIVAYEGVRGAVGIDVEVVVAGVTRLSELVVLVALVATLYAGFAWLVFPRYGGAAYETRPDTVRRQFAVAVVVYGLGFFSALTAAHTWLAV